MASNMIIEPRRDAAADAIEKRASTELRTSTQKPSEAPLREYGLNYRVDPTVTFQEFRHWAKIDRKEEQEAERRYLERRGPMTPWKMLKARFSKGVHHENRKMDERENQEQSVTAPAQGDDTSISSSRDTLDKDWKTAARAMRTAGWSSIFFLVTTDILGWSGAPFVFSTVGYGTGVALYVLFGFAALASGFMLWKVFVTMDSARYPMLSYGDLFFRVFGPKTRHFINISQSIQQFCTVMVLILSKGRTISQLSQIGKAADDNGLCFVACMIIIMACGMVAGSIRSLQRIGWICNISVWLNIASFISMYVSLPSSPRTLVPCG